MAESGRRAPWAVRTDLVFGVGRDIRSVLGSA